MKTPETIKLEKALMKSTELRRTFGVPEVTIGWYGKQRVDFMETNTRAIIRCYEIKVTYQYHTVPDLWCLPGNQLSECSAAGIKTRRLPAGAGIRHPWPQGGNRFLPYGAWHAGGCHQGSSVRRYAHECAQPHDAL